MPARNSAVARYLTAGAPPDGGAAGFASAALSGSGAGNAAVARLLTGGVAQRSATDSATEPATEPARAPATGPDTAPPADFLGSMRASGGGEALPAGFRAEAESGFGVGFAGVRVHQDAAAAAAADQVSARAFTVGSDIYLGDGRYDPDSTDGRHLLAHELTHVAQQAGGPATVAMSSWLSRPADASERAADVAADRFAAGQAVGPIGPGPAVVAREPATTMTSTGTQTKDGGAGPAKAAPAGPGPIGFIPAYDIYQISSDAPTARQQLRDIALTKGIETARLVALDVRMRRSALGLDMVGLVPDLGTGVKAQADAYDAVIAAMQAEMKEWDDFEKDFAAHAAAKARQTLALSKQRVQSEKARYGLTKDDEWTDTELGPARTDSYGMADNLSSRAMASAARQLVDALVPLQEAVKKYETLQPYEGPATWEFDIGARPEDPDPAAWAAAKEELRRTNEQYSLLRNQKETQFPILASFAAYERLGTYELKGVRNKLETVGKGPDGGDRTATLLSADVHDTLDNIQTVTSALDGKTLNIWAADNLVGLTKVEMGVSAGSLRDRVIDQQVADDKSDRSLRDTFIGVFAFALGLLAAPLTGGTSLAAATGATAAAAGSAALSGYLAMEHLQEYQIGKAANATDFDKARVISSTDPSLFWLALDIVGVVVDAGVALHSFKNLAEAAHLAVRARGQAGRAAVKALEDAASKQSADLGRTVRAAAEKERERLGINRLADEAADAPAGVAGPGTAGETADLPADLPAEVPPLVNQIEQVTGVRKGPAELKAKGELRGQYHRQQKEAANVTEVHTSRTDQMVDPTGKPMTYPDGSPYGYRVDGRFDARHFDFGKNQGLTQVTIKVHLNPSAGATAEDLERVASDALAGVQKHYNNGLTMPNGDRLNVNVEWVKNPGEAHLHVDVKPGKGRANQTTWFTDSDGTVHAHELGHQMGLLDEYLDLEVLSRISGKAPGVHQDGSLMGNFWIRDAAGNVVVDPKTAVKDRHVSQIGDDISKAAGGKQAASAGTGKAGPVPEGAEAGHTGAALAASHAPPRPVDAGTVASDLAKSGLGDKVGEGGFGAVFHVPGHDGLVVKLAKADLAATEAGGKGAGKAARKANAQLVKEADYLETLTEAGVPTAYRGPVEWTDATGTTRHGILMDYVEGSFSKEALQMGKFENVPITAQKLGELREPINQNTVRGVEHIVETCKAKGIVFEDLQFIIKEDGSVVLIDPANVLDLSTVSRKQAKVLTKAFEDRVRSVVQQLREIISQRGPGR